MVVPVVGLTSDISEAFQAREYRPMMVAGLPNNSPCFEVSKGGVFRRVSVSFGKTGARAQQHKKSTRNKRTMNQPQDHSTSHHTIYCTIIHSHVQTKRQLCRAKDPTRKTTSTHVAPAYPPPRKQAPKPEREGGGEGGCTHTFNQREIKQRSFTQAAQTRTATGWAPKTE